MNPFSQAGAGGAGGSGASTAADVEFIPSGSISSTNVQDAIEELDVVPSGSFWELNGDGDLTPTDYEGVINNNLVVNSIDLSGCDYSVPWGLSCITTQVDITSNATLANLSDLIQSGLLADKYYRIEAMLFISNTANNGIKLAFATPDTLTATTIKLSGNSFSSNGAIVKHSLVSTLTGSLCAATAAIEVIDIKGLIYVNAAGSLQLQVAQNASHADTLSVLVGSYLKLEQIYV